MILFDFSQIIHNELYHVKADFEKEGMLNGFNLFKHLLLVKILAISKKYKNENEIVLCMDYSSWRYDIHPNYKGRRKIKRKDDGFDWDTFWSLMGEFEKELDEIFPFNIVRIKKAEGDDVVGTLSNHIRSLKPSEKIIIVSNDKDFKQLHYDNVVQYDPKGGEEFKCISPSNELIYLILKGDDSDDIPNVKSDINCFANNVRQTTMWRETKLWDHINNNSVLSDLLLNDEKLDKDFLLENFERNRTLIDLTRCPSDLKRQIIDKYNENKGRIKPKVQLMKYFMSKKMKNMIDRLGEFDKFYETKIKEENIMDFLDD